LEGRKISMRIGIHPALNRQSGGIYQYSANILNGLYAWSGGKLDGVELCTDQFVAFAHDPVRMAIPESIQDKWNVHTFRPPWSPGPGSEPPQVPNPDVVYPQPDMRAWLEESGVEMMIYPWPHRLSFEAGIPYVLAIHDVQHRLQPEFEEVAADGEWERREYLFRNGARHATLLLVDSPTGKEDVLACYGAHGVRAERIKVLPFVAASSIDTERAHLHRDRVTRIYNLPLRYLFYPAQFWPHKNHLRIIEALGALRRTEGLSVPFVMTGAATGRLREDHHDKVLQRAADLGIADQVFDLGYVSDDDITGLYAGAVALVMPTFFGPTNIPVLEAWSLDCPVLTSDIRGVREQAGDAAVLVNPLSVEELACGIKSIWEHEPLRRDLISKGRNRLSSYGRSAHDRRLVEIIQEAKRVLVYPEPKVAARV